MKGQDSPICLKQERQISRTSVIEPASSEKGRLRSPFLFVRSFFARYLESFCRRVEPIGRAGNAVRPRKSSAYGNSPSKDHDALMLTFTHITPESKENFGSKLNAAIQRTAVSFTRRAW
jgi:hypothetical protein